MYINQSITFISFSAFNMPKALENSVNLFFRFLILIALPNKQNLVIFSTVKAGCTLGSRLQSNLEYKPMNIFSCLYARILRSIELYAGILYRNVLLF